MLLYKFNARLVVNVLIIILYNNLLSFIHKLPREILNFCLYKLQRFSKCILDAQDAFVIKGYQGFETRDND